jgi:Rrf2 family transcriptional regulator, iron-sulfur cluster assembly transcription factor
VIITSKSDYGLRAALYLAARGERVRLREISESQHIPAAVCSHIMRKLVAAQIVNSVAGPAGGYTLAREAEDISVASVLAAADRDICIFRCVEDGPEPGRPGCDCDLNGKCAFQVVLKGFGTGIAQYLEELSLADLQSQSAKLPEFNFPAMANGKAS